MSTAGLGAPGQASAGGMNNLTTLIKRLEAATSRLEDIANSATGSEHGGNGLEQANGLSGEGAEETQEDSKGEGEQSRDVAAAGATPAQEQDGKNEDVKLPESIIAMDALIAEQGKAFTEASKGLDPLVEEQALSVSQAFQDQRRFLLTSTRAPKPDPQSPAFMDLLSDLQHHMGSVGDLRDSNRASPMREHFAMVGEGITALQWLIMDGKPAEFVGEVLGGSQMYGNRVLKAYKESDQAHVKFVRAYYALLEGLKAYIQNHYPSGVTWNSSGDLDAMTAYQQAGASTSAESTLATTTATNGTSNSASAGTSAAPPPPPPPPPPPLPNFDDSNNSRGIGSPTTSSSGGGGDMGAIFAQLNKGESVTSGLKKVDASQMVHKNPSLRAGSTVPAAGGESAGDISRSRSPGPEIKPKPASMRQSSSASVSTTGTTGTAQKRSPAAAPPTSASASRPPKKELDGNKWLIENHSSPSAPIEIEVSLSQSILITNCTATTIILKGKANALSISNSPKCQILVESLISSIDVINCPKFAVQITGSVPTILLDQVDGASIYLSKEGLGTEVFSSKCSAVNLVLPPEDAKDEEGDSREVPLPEQIRSWIRDGKVVSEIVEHAG